jgi:hypothetical protein
MMAQFISEIIFLTNIYSQYKPCLPALGLRAVHIFIMQCIGYTYNILFLVLYVSGLEIREYGRRDASSWSRGTLNPQKLAVSSPTSGGRKAGIVRSRTEATEFRFLLVLISALVPSPRNSIGCQCYDFQVRMIAMRRIYFHSFSTTSAACMYCDYNLGSQTDMTLLRTVMLRHT